MDWQQASDYTNQYRGTRRATDGLRAAYATTYALGQVVKWAPLDLQVYSDGATVVPTAAVASDTKIVGVISEDWKGLDGQGLMVSGGLNARGTQSIKATVYGFHPAVLVDQTSGAVALTDGVRMTSSANAVGKAMGLAAPAEGSILGFAMLPSSGIGSTLGAGAVAAASNTLTVGGVPAAGDVYTVNVQIPYAGTASNPINPGVAVVRTVITAPLTSGQAASTTTAATQLAAALNADAVFAKYYLASSAAAVVTVSVVAGNPFLVSTANGATMVITTSGTAGNGLTMTASAAGGSTLTAGGNMAGGTGYVGTCPCSIVVI